jgi:hydroxymethylbilane synthase
LQVKQTIIGTRGSELALWQANHIKSKLLKLGLDPVIKVIKTKGDKFQDLSFDKIEGKGFFTKEIEYSLLNKNIDLAVHSLKDLETEQPKGLCIAAVPKREDPADTLLINLKSVDKSRLLDFAKNSIIGTSSARRKNQLLLFREDVTIKDLRGNVPTRINKLRKGDYDAIVLARAGLNRLEIDLSEFYAIDLPTNYFIPAPSQGALGIQIREDDTKLKELLLKINDNNSFENVDFERKILKGIGGGCHSPFGAFSKISPDGTRNTWISFAENASQIPTRFISKSNNFESIVKKVQSKDIPSSIWISRDLKKDSIFRKVIKKNNHKITDESLIKLDSKNINSLPDCNWIFLNSAFALDSILHLKNDFNMKKIAAFGPATAKHIQKNGLNVDFIGLGTPQQVAEKFDSIISSKEIVFIPSSNKSLGTVQGILKESNKKLLDTYTTILIDKKLKHHDLLVFTSPSNVEAFLNSNKISDQKVISIGPSTTSALKNAGIINVFESFESSELALADTVLSLI